MPRAEPQPASLIMLQFLAWVADRPRTHADVMDAWRSSCPRLSVWEDALTDGLVQRHSDRRVTLTPSGAALLARNRPQATTPWREAAE